MWQYKCNICVLSSYNLFVIYISVYSHQGSILAWQCFHQSRKTQHSDQRLCWSQVPTLRQWEVKWWPMCWGNWSHNLTWPTWQWQWQWYISKNDPKYFPMLGLSLQLDWLCSQSWSTQCWLLTKLVPKHGIPCLHLPPGDEAAAGLFQTHQDLICSG